ncbi:MAG: type II secretion system F family protein [Candidatus Binatia bacterium]
MSIILVALFSFMAVTCLIVMATLLIAAVQTSPQARIKKRLTAISRNPYASKAEIQNLLKNPVYSEIPWLNNFLNRLNFVRSITLLLERANLDISASFFLLFSALFGAIIFILLVLISSDLTLSIAVGIMGLSFPYLYVRYVTWKRLRRFLEQLPDALDMIGQGLQAGLGLTQSMVFVAKEMPDPMGTEFSVFMEEVNLGLPLTDALVGFQERIPLPDVRLLSVAMLVQREVGGSLAELLNKLANVIRDRFRIERQIKTLTAQNRMSAWVVSSLPPVLAAFMFTMDPDLMNEAWSDPVGRTMYLAALVLEILGIIVFRKFIRIRI